MAFARNEMALMAYSGAAATGRHWYSYANTAEDTTTAAEFFDTFYDQLSVNDLIFDEDAGIFLRVTAVDVDEEEVTVEAITEVPSE